MPGQIPAPAPSSSDAIPRQRLGAALRALRNERQMSLTEAAEASGLSRSFISMVENGTTEIAVSRLIRLAGAYGAFAADLLTGVHTTAAPEFVTLEEAPRLPSSSTGVEVQYLASASWSVQPFHVTLQPGSRLEGLSHAGTEFVHGLKGSVRMTVAGETFTLTEGDTLMIPEHAEHGYANDTDAEARILGGVERPPRT